MYRLTAELGDRTEVLRIKALNDFDAITEAIGVIMDEAFEDKSGPWARGKITLTDPVGEVVNTMAAKD